MSALGTLARASGLEEGVTEGQSDRQRPYRPGEGVQCSLLGSPEALNNVI